ncbi:MAG: hypothetical protein IJ031_02705 [Oscillospiraceae bacterium]|nr:hypothetical protein [Oscillospiraceae bacterium]
MIINSVAIALSLITTLFFGWVFMMHFRKQKTGVKSPFIPDGKTLSDNKKTIGTAFACLLGSAVTFFATSFLFEKGQLVFSFCCVVFIASMCFVGFKDDRQLDLMGKNVGEKTQNRLLGIMIVSLLFCVISLASGIDTVVTLPLSTSKIRLSGAFGPTVALFTLLACEGERATGNKNNTEYVRAIIKLTALLVVCAFEEKTHLMLLPSIYIGALAGGIFWTDFKKVLKIGFSDKYIITAMVISACIATQNEGMAIFLFAFEILCLLSKPVDMLGYKISKKHIFNRLPVDEHLKSAKLSDLKIKIFYSTITLLFAVSATAIRIILLKTQ